MRRSTRKIFVRNSDLVIGGNSPISVQGMTNKPLTDVEGNVSQINEMARRGASIVRVAVRTIEEADCIPLVLKKSSIPLCADIHFDYRIALKAIENGINKIRLNPGNITDPKKVEEVVRLAAKESVPIRIGVNSGSIDKKKYSHVTPEALVDSALHHLRILEDLNFDQALVSIKSSDIFQTVEANRMFAELNDYPLHLGLTEAGYGLQSVIQSSIAIGSLLLEGLGDTLRVSMTGDPVEEISVAREILKSTGHIKSGIKIISCPTCGRTDTSIDLEDIARSVDRELSTRFEKVLSEKNRIISVAVMGCEVNGPGEATHADMGIAGARNGEFILFAGGEPLRRIKENEIIEALSAETAKLIS